MPSYNARTCKVTAVFEIAKSNIYGARIGFDANTPVNEIVNFYRWECERPPVDYPTIAHYITSVKNALIKEIFVSIKACGLFGHEDGENDPWDFNISDRTIRAAQRSVQIAVSPDMKFFSITIDHVPETLKYAYQYFDEHEDSTHDEFMAACQGYPRDNFVVDKTREFGDSEFTDFWWVYTGGRFYDIHPLSYSFFY
jgi:hypothetical protein